MIGSITSNPAASAMQSQMARSTQTLSQDQQLLIEETLANFDADNLTQSDAASIVEAFSNAGIQPGRALEEAMAASGFDARSVGEMAGVGPPPQAGGGQMPAGQAGQLNLSDEMLQNLNGLLDEYLDGALEESEREMLLAEIREIFQQAAPEQGLIDVKA
jgi:hypothetical protein